MWGSADRKGQAKGDGIRRKGRLVEAIRRGGSSWSVDRPISRDSVCDAQLRRGPATARPVWLCRPFTKRASHKSPIDAELGAGPSTRAAALVLGLAGRLVSHSSRCGEGALLEAAGRGPKQLLGNPGRRGPLRSRLPTGFLTSLSRGPVLHLTPPGQAGRLWRWMGKHHPYSMSNRPPGSGRIILTVTRFVLPDELMHGPVERRSSPQLRLSTGSLR
jgi:hypothetical protein